MAALRDLFAELAANTDVAIDTAGDPFVRQSESAAPVLPAPACSDAHRRRGSDVGLGEPPRRLGRVVHHGDETRDVHLLMFVGSRAGCYREPSCLWFPGLGNELADRPLAQSA